MNKNLVILCYHGVTKINKNQGIENFSGKHISLKTFKKQINYLKNKKCEFLSLDEITRNIKNKIPFKKNSIGVTFDDGFRNNFNVAVPILKKNKIPATFFLCPKNIDKQEIFWVDKIEGCINKTKKKQIKLDLNKKKIFDIKTYKQKINCIKSIKAFCKNNKSNIKNDLIKQLISQTQIMPDMSLAKNYQIATWKQIKKTIKSKLFSIGGHSLEHDIFTKMSKKNINRNIVETIKIISKKINYKTKYFSYPEGQKNHFNSYVIKILKKNKIVCCPTAISGRNSHLDNPYHLKRIMVGFNNIKLPSFK